MAIIYTYPTKATLATSDLILISDSADGNKTKNATVTSIKDAIDVVDSITATLPLEATSSTGAVTISSRAYSGGATTGFVPSGGTAGNYLDGAGTWSTIDLTTDVNGILPVANGGLGGGAFTEGDLVYYNSSAFTRLATSGVTDGFVITAASGLPTWAASSGPTGSGVSGEIAYWTNSSTLTGSIMTQSGSGATAKIVIGGSPNNGLTFENTNIAQPDVTLLPYSGTSGGNWEMRLPAPPTTGGQVMSLPSTLGSSPYQLEWENKAVINSAGGTFLGVGTPTNTTANLALGSVATPLLNTTDVGDVIGLATGQAPTKFIEVQIGADKYYMALYEQA